MGRGGCFGGRRGGEAVITGRAAGAVSAVLLLAVSGALALCRCWAVGLSISLPKNFLCFAGTINARPPPGPQGRCSVPERPGGRLEPRERARGRGGVCRGRACDRVGQTPCLSFLELVSSDAGRQCWLGGDAEPAPRGRSVLCRQGRTLALLACCMHASKPEISSKIVPVLSGSLDNPPSFLPVPTWY